MLKRRKTQWKFCKVAKIHNLQISQPAKFRNTAPLHSYIDCFLTRLFVVLCKSTLDVILVPLDIFVISLVLSIYISSVKLVTSINLSVHQSLNKIGCQVSSPPVGV